MEQQDLTQVRVAQNQSRFREANENIETAADKMGLHGPVPFICECADERCMEIVRLTLHDYEEVRQHPRRFFNAPGHEALSVESGAAVVVDHQPAYVLVEKIELAGQIAEARYEQLAEKGDDE